THAPTRPCRSLAVTHGTSARHSVSRGLDCDDPGGGRGEGLTRHNRGAFRPLAAVRRATSPPAVCRAFDAVGGAVAGTCSGPAWRYRSGHVGPRSRWVGAARTAAAGSGPVR